MQFKNRHSIRYNVARSKACFRLNRVAFLCKSEHRKKRITSSFIGKLLAIKGDWWRWRELNPRPRQLHSDVYVRSRLILSCRVGQSAGFPNTYLHDGISTCPRGSGSRQSLLVDASTLSRHRCFSDVPFNLGSVSEVIVRS